MKKAPHALRRPARPGGRPAACLALALLVGLPLPLSAAAIGRGSTKSADRQEAIGLIPLHELSEPMRAAVNEVVLDPSIYRRLPTQVIQCDRDIYQFLLRYPEVVVNIWEMMGITKVTMQRTAEDAFQTSDGVGTHSNVRLVYHSEDTHLFYAEAVYDGKLTIRPVHAKCVLLLRSRFLRDKQQRSYVTNRLDVFVRVENVGVELLAKTLKPLVGRAADYNFTETVRFISRVSLTAERNGPGMQRLAARLKKVDPPVRQSFSELALAVSKRAAARPAVADRPAQRAVKTSMLPRQPSWRARLRR